MLAYVLERSPTRGSARLVLLVLADRANDDGVCWPSVADTARRAALSERQTRRLLGKLQRIGELRVLRSGGGRRRDGAGSTNRVLLTAGRSAAELDRLIAEPCQARQGRTDAKPDADDTEPGHARPATLSPVTGYPVAGDRETHSTEPSGNRHREPSQSDAEARFYEAVAAARRRNAARTAPIGKVLPKLPRRRIPDAELARSRTLLAERSIEEVDAHDLASRYPYGDLKHAVEMLPERVRNPGGWIRKCVEGRWWENSSRRHSVNVP